MKQERINYQLDVMKLFFAGIIMLSHTTSFLKEDTTFRMPHALGAWGVFFFFVVSGMLMVNSGAPEGDPAVNTAQYVKGKVRKLLLPYEIAYIINYIVFVVICNVSLTLINLCRVIPQVLFLSSTSFDVFLLNSPAWYISALLIVMIPFYWIYCTNPNFYLYIFSPICGILTYTYIYHTPDHYFLFSDYFGLLSGGIVSGMMGISFGSISYLIARKARNSDLKYKAAILTLLELLLYYVIFNVWFSAECTADTAYSVMLLLPIAIGITFSGESKVGKIFASKLFRIAGPISLAVYLNHATAWRIVTVYMQTESYEKCATAMFALTVVICVVYAVLLTAVQHILKGLRKARQ